MKSLGAYKRLKNSWIKNKKGSLQSFNLGKTFSSVKKDHLFNEVSYALKGNSFVEGNLFMKCSANAFLNISFLTLKNKEKAFKKVWLKLLETIKC